MYFMHYLLDGGHIIMEDYQVILYIFYKCINRYCQIVLSVVTKCMP